MANALAWVTSGIQYILSQDFESAGTPSGWSSAGTVTFHNTTAPLEGTGDLDVLGPTSQAVYTFASAVSELWMVCLIKWITLNTTGNTNSCGVLNASSGTASYLNFVANTGAIRGFNGGQIVGPMVNTVSAGTLYYFKMHYKKGTGADSQSSYELFTSGSWIGSGNFFISTTTGTSVSDAAIFRFQDFNDGDYRLDHIRISTVDLGNSFSNWP